MQKQHSTASAHTQTAVAPKAKMSESQAEAVKEILAKREQENAQAAEKARDLESIKLEVQCLHSKWAHYLSLRHTLPPDLLPLEKAAELERWRPFVYTPPENLIQTEAFDNFSREMLAPFQRSIGFLDNLSRRVKRATRSFSNFIRRLAGSSYAKILRSCRVHHTPPDLGTVGMSAVAAANQLLRSRWHQNLDDKDQSILSVHSHDGVTTIQVGAGLHGSAYISFNGKLDPVELAERIMSTVASQIKEFYEPTSVVTVYDGELAALNPKYILPGYRMVRCKRDNLAMAQEGLGRVLSARPPRPDNTSVHLGLPTSEDQLSTAFSSNPSDAEPQSWESWRPVEPHWRSVVERYGFGDLGEPTSEAILRSLATKENVIIVVAHGDSKTIHLPLPPPEGSAIGLDELEAHRHAIAANKPMVYLFCCETAKVEDLGSFTERLLEFGASAVVAPQTEIGAITSADLLDHFLSGAERESGVLDALREAEDNTGYRAMEVWIG